MSKWINPETIDKTNYAGFVYIIRCKVNDRFYIGQKVYWNKQKLKPLKGKTRCRHKVKESNWKDYWGSSKELQEDIEKFGKENFTRMILENCKSKSLMNYHETKLQFEYEVLFNQESYNKIINCRINSNMIPENLKYG